MTRLDINALTQWITPAAIQHPTRLDAELAARTGVSLRTARRALARLTDLHWLERGGSPRKPVYRPGLLRQVVRRYGLQGLAEDTPWAADFAPCFVLPAAVQRMVQHAFCELLNNAIEHSEGHYVTVSLRQTPSHVQLLVSDDGRGLFSRIAESFSIDDPQLAMLELSKGKLTSQPRSHSGQGLFFTSRLADMFDVHANQVAFQQRAWDGMGWQPRRALKHEGTSVYIAIALDTDRTLCHVRNAYSLGEHGASFDRTVVPLRLMTSAQAGLESRAQARRVAARLSEFGRAELDFDGIADVGHAFADELFRVMPDREPGLRLVPVNMSAAVAAMIGSIPIPALPGH